MLQPNLHEESYFEHVDLVFAISIHEWLNDFKEGNQVIIPKSITEAKEIIKQRSKTWFIYKSSNIEALKEYVIQLETPHYNFNFIREEIVTEHINDLFIDKVEVIDLAVKMKWKGDNYERKS